MGDGAGRGGAASLAVTGVRCPPGPRMSSGVMLALVLGLTS